MPVSAPAHRDESADEYSDLASVRSETNTKPLRRKHKRGGRKASYEEPTPEETAGLLGPDDGPDNGNYDQDENEDEGQDQEEGEDQEEEEDEICRYCSRKFPVAKPQVAKSQPKRRIPEPFETGIRAFNVRKAAGGRRPVGVRTTAEKKKTKTSPAKSATKSTSSTKSGDAVSDSESQASNPKTGNEEDEPEEENEEAGAKPMSIRLDLDLMIEVFLKAKIKGAVTITFLE